MSSVLTVASLTKNMFLVFYFQNNYLMLSLSYHFIDVASDMQSNGDLLSAKIEQSVILIHNAKRRNALYDDQKVNNLRKSFVSPGDMLGKNSCIACTHLPLLYILAVTLHSRRMMFTLIFIRFIRFIWFMWLSWFQYSIRKS